MSLKLNVSKSSQVLLVLLAITAALALTACGSDDESSSPGNGGPATAAASGNGVDLAFVEAMTPHHNSAVAMATTAQERSDRDEIQELADAIVKSQTAEIAQMEKIAAALKTDGVTAGDLGVPEHQMGMSADGSALEAADPFDRTFIDMMVAHHQGAIRMARAVLARGESAETRKLAEAIIDAQSREIGEMNDWRKQWYGAASPAGGIPAEGEADSEDGAMMPGHAE